MNTEKTIQQAVPVDQEEVLILTAATDARTANNNLKRFLKEFVGVECRVGVGNSTRKGVTVEGQYINARLNFEKWQKGEVRFPEVFQRLCILEVYPENNTRGFIAGTTGCIHGNMITMKGRQWEAVCRRWYYRNEESKAYVESLMNSLAESTQG